MQKIISVIMSILMALFGAFVPGSSQPKDPVTTGEWLSTIVSEFGMEDSEYDAEPHYEDIQSDNTYFAVVQIAYEWGVIDDADVIDVDANVTSEFVVKTLVKVARLEWDEKVDIANAKKLKYVDEIAIAVGNGLVSLKNGAYKVAYMGREACMELLAKAKELWSNKTFDETVSETTYTENVVELDTTDYVVNGDAVILPADTDLAVGDVYTLPQTAGNVEGRIFKVESIENNGDQVVANSAEVPADEVIEKVNFEGSVSSNVLDAQIVDAEGNVLNEATVENGSLVDDGVAKLKEVISDKLSNGSIKVGKAKVNYAVNDNGFDIGISGDIVDGVNVAKSYSVSNLDIQTKFDANIVEKKIKEAYVTLDYDCVDTTTVSGSYAATVQGGNQADTALKAIDQIKANFENAKIVSGSNGSVKLFDMIFVIPNCPAVTITLEVSINFNVFGQAQLVITSNNCKGYEIINNQGRFINDSVELSKQIKATGTAEITATLMVAVGIAGLNLVDVALTGGVGVYGNATITLPGSAAEVLEVPVDLVVEVTAVTDDADEITVLGHVDIYGILRVSVGQNSLVGKVGLKKSWTIFDRSNATFASFDFDETGIIAA